jgi:hypothetical protein
MRSSVRRAQALLRKLAGKVLKKALSELEKRLVFTQLFQLRFGWASGEPCANHLKF